MAVGGQAELIYVKGPQAGQRASLMSAIVVVGRGQQADVQLTEEHVSRKHLQLTLTHDGWVFENTSPLRSCVNGKKYKAGKRIILDTGDVIGVGVETELLFVATGDDPEAALIAYRQDGVKKSKSRSASGAVAAPAPDQKGEPGDDKQPGALEQIESVRPSPKPQDEEEVELDEEELAILAQKAKFKKYATIFGIYLGAIAVIMIMIATMRTPTKPDTQKGRPALLNNDQIEELIKVSLIRDNNPVEARIALDKALEELDRTNKIDYLSRTIYWFKLAQAYGKVLNTSDETKFISAKRRLTSLVQEKYRNAYAYQRDHKYNTANFIFRELLDMLPSMGPRDEQNELRKNIIDQVAYIRRLARKKKN